GIGRAESQRSDPGRKRLLVARILPRGEAIPQGHDRRVVEDVGVVDDRDVWPAAEWSEEIVLAGDVPLFRTHDRAAGLVGLVVDVEAAHRPGVAELMLAFHR